MGHWPRARKKNKKPASSPSQKGNSRRVPKKIANLVCRCLDIPLLKESKSYEGGKAEKGMLLY